MKDFFKKLITIAMIIISNLIIMVSCSVVKNNMESVLSSPFTEIKISYPITTPVKTEPDKSQPTQIIQATDITPNNGLNIPKGDYILFEQDSKINAFSTATNSIYTLENLPFNPSVTDFIFEKNLNKVAYMSFFASDSIRFKDLKTDKNWKIDLEGYCPYISPRLGSWSPDGRFITITCEQIYIVDVANGNIVQVSELELPTRLIHSSWSPDGEKIFYVFMPDMQYGEDKGDVGLYLTDIQISSNYDIILGETKFWDRYSISFFYEWSPDSKYIFFGNYPVIHIIRIDKFAYSRLIDIGFEDNLDFDEYYPELIIHTSPFVNEIAFSYGRYLAIYSIYDETAQIINSPIEHIIDWVCYPGDDADYCDSKKTTSVDFYFDAGKKYRVTPEGNNLNLRNGPSLESSILDQLDFGSEITFLEGPSYKENEVWWYVADEKSGHKGWIVENKDWLKGIK